VTIPAATEVTVASGGVFTAEDSGGDLKGTITVKSGGISKDFANNGSGGGLWKDAGSSGKYVFEQGAKAYLGDDLIIGTSTDTDAWVQLTSGTFSNSQTEYSLDGEATVAHNFGFRGIVCTLTEGSKLTIAINDERIDAEGKWPGFWVLVDTDGTTYGTITGAGSGDDAAVIEIKTPVPGDGKTGYGWLTFHVKSATETDNVNFYDEDSAKITTTITGTDPLQLQIPFGVYKWDASLGSGAGGWKAQATQ
jgi:hypothetical protein